jgi:hypothetical protein
MKQLVGTVIFSVLYYVVLLNGTCLPKITTKMEEETATQKQTKDQPSLKTPQNISNSCELINRPCLCGIYSQDCVCECTTIHESAEKTAVSTENISMKQKKLNTDNKSETIMTSCPNQCWCGYSSEFINDCECNCLFAIHETPHVILTWDEEGTDLDLYVIDPYGTEIYYSHQSSSSGGKLMRDIQKGPNAVEFISWGLIQDGIKGPNGNYKVYVKGFGKSGRTPYNIAILESPDKEWNYINGEISYPQKPFVYQFHIYNDFMSSLHSNKLANFSEVCKLIYNADCECGFDINCHCACQLATRSTVSLSFDTTTSTSCPNECWCGYSYEYIKNCECNCFFALGGTPYVILTWDEVGTDLDLYVIDPYGDEIYYSHQSSLSGGIYMRDSTSGPNAVEVIS